MFEAKRPILIYGAGIRAAGAEREAIEFAERTGIPVCLTWACADLFNHDHPLRVGTFGTHGNRYANFAVQNADYVLSVGSRLDTKATGSPVSGFAPKARVVMVDIDRAELDKFAQLGREVVGLCLDAKKFFAADLLETFPVSRAPPEWLARIAAWKERYPAVLPAWREEAGINPYVFVEKLSEHLRADDVIVSDTGCALGWMMQAYRFKGERFIHAMNMTPMGYGLPAAVGAAFATGKRVICITGDGGLSVNITEMATIERHQLPVKVFLFQNHSHQMCQQTQRQWLNGEYPATSYEGGLATPHFPSIAAAYGFDTAEESTIHGAVYRTHRVMCTDRPSLVELSLPEGMGIAPQARYGAPLEDQEPALDRAELAEAMA